MFSETFDRVAFAKLLQSKLRILRAASNRSQTETANALGLVRSTYVNYENRTKEIPWEKCLAMLFYFETIPECREIIGAFQLIPDYKRSALHDK